MQTNDTWCNNDGKQQYFVSEECIVLESKSGEVSNIRL